MTLKGICDYCLAKKGAYLDFPFSNNSDYAVVKVRLTPNGKARIFAEIFILNGRDALTFSCDADSASFIRSKRADVFVKGWHCPPAQAKYKTTAYLDKLQDIEIYELLDISYLWNLTKL